ncbi:MAG: hypothetical protein WCR07_15705 [Verrucomicrobiota bacterium]
MTKNSLLVYFRTCKALPYRTSVMATFTVAMILTITLAADGLAPADKPMPPAETASKQYVGQVKPTTLVKLRSFKFISHYGEFTKCENPGKEVEKKKAGEFATFDSALTYIRDAGPSNTAVIVGNSGVSKCIVVDGSQCITFLELTGSGCVHSLAVADIWDKDLGGFKATYSRSFILKVGEQFTISTSVYYGIALPFE